MRKISLQRRRSTAKKKTKTRKARKPSAKRFSPPRTKTNQWREPRVDLAGLARLRWIEGLSTKDLAKHYGKSECAIQNYYQVVRRLDLKDLDLSQVERRKIKKALVQKSGF